MYFGLSDEQAELSHIVRVLLERRSDSLAVRAAMVSDLGYDPELWRTLTDEIGAAALSIPEEFGGAGYTSFETNVILEELGYALTPSPLLGSVVLAGHAVMLAANRDACERLLPQVAGGTIAALAWADTEGNWRTDGSDIIAAGGDDGWSLTGTATLVLNGTDADVLLAVARTETAVGLFEIVGEDGVNRISTRALDPTISLCTLVFDKAAARPLLLDAAGVLTILRAHTEIAIAALQVGAARRGLDMTVQYSKERVQFGRPIGSFQALKHRMADMHLLVETAQTVSWAGSWASAIDAPDLQAQAELAKSWCTDALDHVAAETVQLHGGIAITWEHDAQLILKRAHALGQIFGPAAHSRRRLFELVDLAGR